MSFLVYVLSDPVTGAIRYVGKTTRGLKERLKGHWRMRNDPRSTHLFNWLRSLPEKPTIEIVEEFSDEVSLNEGERFYISYFRSLGIDLTNLTDGGEGTSGYKVTRTPEWTRKLGLAHRALKGRPKGIFTKEHRGAISRARRTRKEEPRRTETWLVNQARARGGTAIVDQFGTRYETIRGAARQLGLKAPHIQAVLAGLQKTTGGYSFTRVTNG